MIDNRLATTDGENVPLIHRSASCVTKCLVKPSPGTQLKHSIKQQCSSELRRAMKPASATTEQHQSNKISHLMYKMHNLIWEALADQAMNNNFFSKPANADSCILSELLIFIHIWANCSKIRSKVVSKTYASLVCIGTRGLNLQQFHPWLSNN